VCCTVEAVGDRGRRPTWATGLPPPTASALTPNSVAPTVIVAQVSDGVTFDVAAGSILRGMTAHFLIKSVYPAKQGDTWAVQGDEVQNRSLKW